MKMIFVLVLFKHVMFPVSRLRENNGFFFLNKENQFGKTILKGKKSQEPNHKFVGKSNFFKSDTIKFCTFFCQENRKRNCICHFLW